MPLGRRVFVYCFTLGVIEYEFQDVFMLVREMRPDAFVLQKEEVDGVLEMELDRGIRLFAGEVRSIECSLYRNSTTVERVAVSSEDFVPCLDNYYLKLLLLARRYLQGERKLFFI